MNIIFSILVHEKIEIVLNQIDNFNKFNPNSGIILHLSKKFRNELGDSVNIIESLNNVYINPSSIDTGLGDNSQFFAHHLNLEYLLKSKINFDYIGFHASNDMFVKPGLYEYIKQYDAGSDNSIQDKNSTWRQAKMAFNDPNLKTYKKYKSELNNQIYGSQIEGSYISKQTAKKINNDVINYSLGLKYSLHQDIMRSFIKNKYFHFLFNLLFPGFYYAKEEIYMAMLIKGNAVNISKPYVFINWKNNLKISESEISAIINENYDYLSNISSISIDRNKFNFFAVKRVERLINDPIRVFINKL